MNSNFGYIFLRYKNIPVELEEATKNLTAPPGDAYVHFLEGTPHELYLKVQTWFICMD